MRTAFGHAISRVPKPYPTRARRSRTGSGANLAKTVSKAAPVGVVNSPGSPGPGDGPKGASARRKSSSVAGAGTGSRPWADFTQPDPVGKPEHVKCAQSTSNK